MEDHKKPWFLKKAKAVVNISIDAGKAAAKAPWPISDLILAKARAQCEQIAGVSQFYDAAVKPCCTVGANTGENKITLNIKGLDVIDSGLVIEVIGHETKQR